MSNNSPMIYTSDAELYDGSELIKVIEDADRKLGIAAKFLRDNCCCSIPTPESTEPLTCIFCDCLEELKK